MTFQHPDPEKFPALAIAKRALLAGGRAPAAMNAANECAVAAFLNRRIAFLDIPNIVAETLERMDRIPDPTRPDDDAVQSANQTDAEARRVAGEVVTRKFAA